MPMEYRYDEAKQTIYAVAKGSVNTDELDAFMTFVTQAEEFSPDTRTLWDLRELDFNSVDRQFVEQFVNTREKYPDRGAARIAMIVGSDHGFGMTRMYEMLSDRLPQNIKVFREPGEATAWLFDPDA